MSILTDSPLLSAFDRQVVWCREPSPFTSRVLARSRAWLAADAEAHDSLADIAADPLAAAVSLRWAAGLHALALRGLAPWASLWPPAQPEGGVGDAVLDAALRAAWQDQRQAMAAALANAPQTNEVQRSAVLLPGLLSIAAATGLPLALREIGASAGLNLWCDRHRHEHGCWRWGAADAALTLESEWRGPVPAAAAAQLDIVDRAACDMQPVNLLESAERLRLTSFIWPDQADRLARLAIAMREAVRWMGEAGVVVQACSAADFVADVLARQQQGVTTVLMHSVVWQYLPATAQARIAITLNDAAARATRAAPLAWLRMEPPAPDLAMELRCTIWPGGEERRLARVHPHGAWIEWLP